MRRAARVLFACGTIPLLVGCGNDGGGGSKAAFCDNAEEITTFDVSGASNDPSERTRWDELTAAAPDEVKADMATVNAFLNGDASGSDDVDKLLSAAEHLRDYATEECGLELAGDTGSNLTTTTIAGTSSTDDPGDGSGGGSSSTTAEAPESTATTSPPEGLPEPTPVPPGSDEQLNALAQKCHDGDMQACDDLYQESEIDSEYEAYGNSCGGRAPDNTEFCVDVYP